jgi:hypothetical protein
VLEPSGNQMLGGQTCRLLPNLLLCNLPFTLMMKVVARNLIC